MYVPDTEDRLWGWLRMAFGVAMPRKVWTPGHSSPFAFLWDAYSNPAQDVAAWACRSGGKTLGASLLAALEYGRYDNLQARVLSGSEDQAKFLYGYWSNWCNGYLKGRVQGEVNRLLTRVAGGQFEILAPAGTPHSRGLSILRRPPGRVKGNPRGPRRALPTRFCRSGLTVRTGTGTIRRLDDVRKRPTDHSPSGRVSPGALPSTHGTSGGV